MLYYIFPQIEKCSILLYTHIYQNWKQTQHCFKAKKIFFVNHMRDKQLIITVIVHGGVIKLRYYYQTMGNIQVVRSPPKRKNIFNQMAKSEYRQSRSPRVSAAEMQNTHRFTNSNRVYKIRQSDGEDTSRNRSGSFYRKTQNKISRTNHLVQALQQSQPSNTSNRIVNFNDFLIQIKKQMTENSNHCSEGQSQFEHTIKKSPQQEKRKSSDGNMQLKVNLKLQNQRFQLDKYKKIVQRQLSKSHSIENITLQNKHQNEKLLIIKYGEYNKEEKRNQLSSKSLSKLSFAQGRSQTALPNTNLNQKIMQEKRQYASILEKAKQMMNEMTQRVQRLGDLIEENQQSQSGTMHFQQKQLRNDRISRISGLLNNINHLQATQIALQSQIKAAIQVDDESEISETLTESQLAKLQRKK